MIGTPCPIGNLKQQVTNLKQAFIQFSPLRAMDFRRNGFRIIFEFFQENYLPDGPLKATVATAEKLSDIWKPRAMDANPPLVMNCSCF